MRRLALSALLVLSLVAPASAGDYSGDTLVRVQGTYVAPDSSAKVYSGGTLVPSYNSEVSDAWIPTLTLTHFFTKNIAAELFCCFAHLNAQGTSGAINGADLGGFWAFPPILTLQYHFDPISGLKPYVGAGVQYIHYFGGGHSDLGGAKIKLDDSWGFALQGGVDVEIGRGWYLNADIKKVWEDTDASWSGTPVTAKVTVDPLIVSVGLGYRFNLADLLGGRSEPAPLK
ncbi:OmpW family outer membrane protein [Hyphomicrobium sp.]|uniref:OmpW/AlkL family protein n=1 Tax=Hyphomicrobium sp. TaxID=82 RepID=UPI000FB4F2BA|nr:OmpW family outer membrane protein [Hyphomicrobium sp.]RUP00621.1 MAG: OmpW family protein [Hyphomicrobium sp.]